MKIGLGSDHNGFELKVELLKYLKDKNYEVIDYGCYSQDDIDYPDIAFKLAENISNTKVDRGILVCGTGLGMAIAANKHPGVRAATTHDVYSAERAQLSNNAQIITLGAQIIGVELAKKVVQAYLDVEWAEGSKRKLEKINEQEQSFVNKASK